MASTTGTTPDSSGHTDHTPPSRGRRTRRSRRTGGALALLVLATALVAAVVVLGDPLVVSLGAGGSVLLAWASYRLLRAEVVATRRECATERRDLARSYRDLFDRRADEVAEQQRRLREVTAATEHRASTTQAMLDDVRRRLAEAEERFAAMAAAAGDLPEITEDEPTIPIRTLERVGSVRVVPEWARLEADPLQALLAWEEHAGRTTGSHAAEERKQA